MLLKLTSEFHLIRTFPSNSEQSSINLKFDNSKYKNFLVRIMRRNWKLSLGSQQLAPVEESFHPETSCYSVKSHQVEGSSSVLIRVWKNPIPAYQFKICPYNLISSSSISSSSSSILPSPPPPPLSPHILILL